MPDISKTICSPPAGRQQPPRKGTSLQTHGGSLFTARNCQEILDHLPMFVYLIPRDFTLRYVNSSFRKEFGIPDQFTRCYSILRKVNKPCEQCPAMSVFADTKERSWLWKDGLRGKVYEVYNVPYGNIEETSLVLGIGVNVTATLQRRQQSAVHDHPDDFLRICCYCNKINNRKGHWQKVESYSQKNRASGFPTVSARHA